MIANALAGKPLPVYGGGQNVRDWLYVGDHCSAIRNVPARGVPGETYNVGGWNEKKNLDGVVREPHTYGIAFGGAPVSSASRSNAVKMPGPCRSFSKRPAAAQRRKRRNSRPRHDRPTSNTRHGQHAHASCPFFITSSNVRQVARPSQLRL